VNTAVRPATPSQATFVVSERIIRAELAGVVRTAIRSARDRGMYVEYVQALKVLADVTANSVNTVGWRGVAYTIIDRPARPP